MKLSRIDHIGLNGGDGLHYQDVKKQMIEEETGEEFWKRIALEKSEEVQRLRSQNAELKEELENRSK
jgi:hypothetical protein